MKISNVFSARAAYGFDQDLDLQMRDARGYCVVDVNEVVSYQNRPLSVGEFGREF